jgi:hypothetical protein
MVPINTGCVTLPKRCEEDFNNLKAGRSIIVFEMRKSALVNTESTFSSKTFQPKRTQTELNRTELN